MSRSLLRVSIAALVLVLQSGGARGMQPAVPFFWGVALSGSPITAERLARVTRETGIRPQLVVFYVQWPAALDVVPGFPQQSLEAIWKVGAIPCISWEPMNYQGNKETMIPYEEILQGRYDSYLKTFARAVRRWQKPLIIRFAHEMNLERYHWGTTQEAFGARSPEIYRHMFRYLVTLFRQLGADNVLWAFCPNAESVPNPAYHAGSKWNEATNYYPGDDFVDLVGMDGYNWGTTQTRDKNGWNSHWQSFAEIFSHLHKTLRSVAPNKPLLVFETASVAEAGNRAVWVREALATLERWQVQGMVWFQADKEVDWRLDSTADREAIAAIQSRLCCCSQAWLKHLLTAKKRHLKQ